MSAEKRIVSYCDPLSARPGDEVRFMVSSLDGEAFDGRLVRIVCGDVSPGGHGYEEIEIDSALDGRYDGVAQPTHLGSYAVVEPNPFLEQLEDLRFEMCVFPTLIGGARTLVSTVGDPGGFSVELDEGVPVARIGAGTASLDAGVEIRSDRPITFRRWTKIVVTYDSTVGRLALDIEPLVSAPGDVAIARRWAGEVEAHASVASNGPLFFAVQEREGVRSQHFDGRLDACGLGPTATGAVEARWDFSLDIATERITDTGPHSLDGRTVQLPARAVPGVRWNGDVHDFRVDPSHYGAIHFHSDDLADAAWETSCSLRVPDDLDSGVYALRTRCGDSEDHAVFFVLPSNGAEPAAVAWLAPTITYRAYANVQISASPDHIFGNWSSADIPNDRFLLAHPECGLGLYDHHADLTGVAYSSHLRPVMNLKPGGGLWSFTADTNVVAWLDHTGVEHDVITDDAVHDEGLELLSRYRVIVTGTHPEYWTTPMLDALGAWQRNGGRLMVLGANGFYWRTGVHPAEPAVVEVRRAEDGTRAWMAEPGEYYMESTGELGGLWSRIGRGPHEISGAGFAGQGFSTSGHYRRSTAWNDSRVAFALEGLSDREEFGDHGTVGGGAAGQEIDRYDERLGSPSHAIVLASSVGHPPDMLQTKEEFFATGIPYPGTEARADVVFYELPHGGAVFTTGSIAWAGSLATDGYDNDVARLTTNVLRRFADEQPFEVPDGVTTPSGVPEGADPLSLVDLPTGLG